MNDINVNELDEKKNENQIQEGKGSVKDLVHWYMVSTPPENFKMIMKPKEKALD